jgi:hypothetical protein
MTAQACLLRDHRVYHIAAGTICDTCTAENGRRAIVYVLPPRRWTDHVHRLTWVGFDGADNTYRCTRCDIHSYDHGQYAIQQHKVVADAVTPTTARGSSSAAAGDSASA